MYQLDNVFYGELDLSGGDITSGATAITLETGDVARLGKTPTATDPMLFAIWDRAYEHAGAARKAGGKWEIISVTAKDDGTDTLTAGTRGFSNSTAQSYNSADNTTYGIVQVSADELFDALLIVNSSSQIVDRSGTVLNAPSFSGMSDDNVDITGGIGNNLDIGLTSRGRVEAEHFATSTTGAFNDDTVHTITPNRVIGVILVSPRSNGYNSFGGLVSYRATSSNRMAILMAQNSDFFHASTISGAPSGTSGTGGAVTVFVSDDGNIYLENRSGVTIDLNYTFLGK